MRSCCYARWLFLWPVLGCLGLMTLHGQEKKEEASAVRRGMVVVLDGAGEDSRGTSTGLGKLLAGSSLQVRTFGWSTGDQGTFIKDFRSSSNHQAKGAELAERVMAHRNAHPDLVICLVGFSSGCSVILAAVDSMPPNSVDRIILMAPAVSIYHDLGPALRCSRCGVNVFYSKEDTVFRLLNDLVSPPDQKHSPFAGNMGFLYTPTPGDEALACKLKQYYWHQGISWTGHKGNHGGYVKLKFLDYAIVPLLVETAMPPAHK